MLGITAKIQSQVLSDRDILLITLFKFFRANDAYFVIAIGNENLWGQLCRTLDAPDLLKNCRFTDNASRSANQQDLEKILEEYFGEHSEEYWLESLWQAGIPCGPI